MHLEDDSVGSSVILFNFDSEIEDLNVLFITGLN